MKVVRVTELDATHVGYVIASYWITRLHSPSIRRKLLHFLLIFLSLNPLKTKRRLLYLNTQSVPRSKHFSTRL